MRNQPFGCFYTVLVLVLGIGIAANNVWAADGTTLTLSEALLLASEKHPELAVYQSRIQASETRLERAGRRPNPQLSFQLENFAGSGPVRSFSGSEITLAFTQIIELGAKRRKRAMLADSDVNVASTEYRRTEVRLLRDVSLAFINLVEAQTLLDTDRRIVEAAKSVYESVSANVTAGKVPPVEEVKAKVELAQANLQALKTKNAIVYRRDQLASTMGLEALGFARLQADLSRAEPPKAIGAIYDELSNNLDLVLLDARIQRSQKAVVAAKAKRVPNVSLSAGVRRLEGSDDNAAVMFLSVPLLIFDDRKTFAVEAEHDLTAAMEERRSTEFSVRGEIANAHRIVRASFEEFRVMRDEVVPSAVLALDRISESYRLGKLSLLDLIDSQRTLFDAKRQVIQSAAQYHRASILLESLIGGTGAKTNSSEGEQQL